MEKEENQNSTSVDQNQHTVNEAEKPEENLDEENNNESSEESSDKEEE